MTATSRADERRGHGPAAGGHALSGGLDAPRFGDTARSRDRRRRPDIDVPPARARRAAQRRAPLRAVVTSGARRQHARQPRAGARRDGIASNTARRPCSCAKSCSERGDPDRPRRRRHLRPTRRPQGVAGVRVYLEDGRYAVTDDEGKYHFEGVTPGSHVVQIDTITLPEQLEPLRCDTACATPARACRSSSTCAAARLAQRLRRRAARRAERRRAPLARQPTLTADGFVHTATVAAHAVPLARRRGDRAAARRHSSTCRQRRARRPAGRGPGRAERLAALRARR